MANSRYYLVLFKSPRRDLIHYDFALVRNSKRFVACISIKTNVLKGFLFDSKNTI